jgi:energy-coupling factor transporter ATP-binding protein EcfA2/Zn ribbon nucleic-acid-binding protein
MSNETVVGRSQCPSCVDTAQDNLINYSDGGANCFACGYHVSGTGSKAPFSVNQQKHQVTQMELSPFFSSKRISATTLERYSVKAFVNEETGVASVGFPLLNASGQFGCYHYRLLDTATGTLTRDFYYRKGAKVKCPLFGWQLVNSSTKTVVVCEGETDTLALAEHLQNRPDTVVVGAVGTGFGRKVAAWLKAKANSLKVVLAFDNDKAGRTATAEVVDFLSDETKVLYKLPFNAQDVGDAIVADENLLQTFDSGLVVATTACFKNSHEVADDVVEFIGLLKNERVVQLKFSPTLDNALKLTPGSLVAIIGAGGCGKSTLAEHMLLEALNAKDLYACMISAEMAAYEVALKLLSTIDAKSYHDYDVLKRYTEQELADLHKRIKIAIERFSIVDDFGGMVIEQIETTILEQIAAGQPPALVVVDHMLAVAENLENTSLELIAKALKAVAINCHTCVVVICHTRKAPSQRNSKTIYRPTLNDEYGSGGLQKYANCVLGVAIDRPKRALLVETLKVNRMGGSYADVTLTLDNWQLKELQSEQAETTAYPPTNEDYDDGRELF